MTPARNHNNRWICNATHALVAHHRRTEFIEHLKASSEGDFDAVAIIYGELVGNVVRHTDGPICIVFEWRRAAAVLSVRDFGKGFDHDFHLPDSLSESGRGLFIVRKLAEDVDIVCDPTGCEVRATLPLRRAATQQTRPR